MEEGEGIFLATRRGSLFGGAAENIAKELFTETNRRPRSESFFQRLVQALKNQLSRIVRKDSSALEKVESHGLCNVSLEGDFVQMKPKISFPVKAEIALWFQFLPPQKRLAQDVYANNVRSLRADRFRRDSDLDRYLGVHTDIPSMRKRSHLEPMNVKLVENFQPFQTNCNVNGNFFSTSEQAFFEQDFDKLSWNQSSGDMGLYQTGFGSSWMDSVADYSKISIPPISPTLSPPQRRLSTPERDAKRRRVAANQALQTHATQTRV